ncbi:hypothetical protein [Rhodococcoides corynebacterioides]|uniref:hypothetical protein n=1 Tax=Rhodococcoides corynebacterioides TaxID=53972 RepID=UPI001C9A629F|nr:hypothetical protein [Rhodococcus corynebacterioides]MBY6363047.1 hypothetical protein [Rhodococcus corynebacterioides]
MKRTSAATLLVLTAAGAALAAPAVASAAPLPPDGVYVGTDPSGAPVPFWQGKTIIGGGTAATNRVLGADVMPADVYSAPSIATGADVIHVDYGRLSPALGALVHDEMTVDPANPGRYNGTVYFVGFGGAAPIGGFTLTR